MNGVCRKFILLDILFVLLSQSYGTRRRQLLNGVCEVLRGLYSV